MAPRRPSCALQREASRNAAAGRTPTRRIGAVRLRRPGAAIPYAAPVPSPAASSLGAVVPSVPSVRRWLGRFGGTLTLAVLAGVLAGLAAVALRSALHFASGALVGRFAD